MEVCEEVIAHGSNSFPDARRLLLHNAATRILFVLSQMQRWEEPLTGS